MAWVAGYVMRQFTCPKAVTHLSTNRARCRATALIETNALPLHQTANQFVCVYRMNQKAVNEFWIFRGVLCDWQELSRFRWCSEITMQIQKYTFAGILTMPDCNKLCAGGRHNMPRPLQVDLWPFYLESGVRVTCDVGYLCANFSLPGPLCSRLRPDVHVRQTSDAHHRLMLPTLGAGHDKGVAAARRMFTISEFLYPVSQKIYRIYFHDNFGKSEAI